MEMATLSTDASFVISVVATVLLGAAAHAFVLPVLRSRRLVDIPNHRSSHSKPTVRGGGLGIIAALIGGLALGVALIPLAGAGRQAVIWFGVTAVAFATLGWTEDLRGLSIAARLGGQVAISVTAAMSATALGGLPLGLAVLAVAGGVFYANAANFMDGVNGISAWHGALVGAYFAAIGVMSDSNGLVLAGLVTAAAFLSFLPWNAPRARMFMGDVGSYCLGGAAWALCVFAVALGTPLLVAVAPLIIYASDVLFTLLKRARRRAPLLDAHREHTYQQVQQLTGSHRAASALTTTTTAACATIGILGMRSLGMRWWHLFLIALVVAAYLAAPMLLTLGRLRSPKAEIDG